MGFSPSDASPKAKLHREGYRFDSMDGLSPRKPGKKRNIDSTSPYLIILVASLLTDRSG